MRKLIIIRGNSGSGKSSVAKELQRRVGRNTLMIPQDIVRREMLWARDGYNTAAIPLLIALIEYGYTNSEITILEGIFNSAWYKPLFVVCYPSSRHFKYRKIFGFCRPVLGGIFMLLSPFFRDTLLA